MPESDSEELSRVVARVRERIDPDAVERSELSEAVDALSVRVEAALDELGVVADIVQVGSTARGTWLSGDRDIDLFVRFPAETDRESLERYGLAVGDAVLPDGREEYAEHPYVTGEFEGFDVDLVPCFDVEDGASLRSAVDRTPHHNDYLKSRLDDELAAEVRVFKRFLKGIGAYGSNLRTRGFSGYLTELLVLEHGGFEPLLRAAVDWHPPVEFDPEDHGTRSFDDPLVVVDPTDPTRNVAAVCSAENVARLQHYARELLADPNVETFFGGDPDPLSPEGVREHVRRRGTHPVAVVFDAPDVVEDQLYPQLYKSISGVASELERRGFEPMRTATFAADRAVLFVELVTGRLPNVERHGGPPVHVREHAEGFYETYAADDTDGSDTDDSDTYGPFLDDDRYAVEREREFTDAVELLESSALFEVGLGSHVESSLTDGYEILAGEAVGELADEFGVELARYFDPRP
ncbi:CCA tRNA nucleotidyltransferase [Halogeometricum sp. S1BR25-6]|uniref:CCA-adding enzyme n=1 Tax=Halogeometricum salsisoli TaxID=2950536 RepID=A0ABU2GAC5_9EURY|nr:CCA tRNA nucleotidyltransferase [Halogeometricum sp. S1BR25-6]MDS0297768.1 CCA tRNA nucleotidyltransferase [Halogeometricum sp. S1BR25-6]